MELQVFNNIGMLIHKQIIQTSTTMIDFQQLPAGTYIFKLSDDKHQYEPKKLIIVK